MAASWLLDHLVATFRAQPLVKSFVMALTSSGSSLESSRIPNLGKVSFVRDEPTFKLSRQDIVHLAKPH